MSVGTSLDVPELVEPSWRSATLRAPRRIADDIDEVPFDVESWPGWLPGQYVDVRMPGPEGWSRVHSFSIASTSPIDGAGTTRVMVAARADVFAEVAPGTRLSVDGPKGTRMAWRPESTGDRPLLLIGGGTGIVPLLAIAHDWREREDRGELILIHSVRTLERQPYQAELARLETVFGAEVATVLTGDAAVPVRTGRSGGRLTALDLELFGVPWQREPECFVCGPAPFVDSVTRMLVEAKHPAVRIRTEWDVSIEEAP